MDAALSRRAQVDLYTSAVAHALAQVPEATYRAFTQDLLGARQIVTAGRGRSGMMAAAFARRLGQLGLAVWGLDDTSVPRLGAGDVMVACTGSGQTPTVLSLMRTARSGGARVLGVTREGSRLTDYADVVATLDTGKDRGPYPLGTLFEASLLGFLDQVAVDLIAALGATESDLGARHTNLE